MLFLILLFYVEVSSAQPGLPQRVVTVSPSQNLYFGLFLDMNGSGGTISIDWQGNRTTTGSIVALPSYPGWPALFEIKLCQGRNVIITYDLTTTLTETNGEALTLDIGPTEKGENGAVFATDNNCNFITVLRVGGTLHIPPNSTAAEYNGNFEISFEQQ
tara:strand:+ start:1650 stop:2126 length:477 start_codon:yes stop_codon:yes gene_type:complete